MGHYEKKWLLFIFVVVVATRIILAFSIPNFTYESYYHLRQVEHITQTGFPQYEDPLSYGGRELRFLPFFHYFMALFAIFFPLQVIAKIVPNILIASITLIVYLISKNISGNKTAPLLSAFIAGFLPILYSTNAFVVETLFLPLIFLAIYFFLNLHHKRYVYLYSITFLMLCLTNPLAFLLIIGFAFSFLLSIMERKKIDRAELELSLFSLFSYLLIELLFFKNTLLQEGVSFFWQNIPSRIIQEYFPALSITESLILVGIIPFIAGVFIVYNSLFKVKNQRAFLLISFVLTTTFLVWLRLIQFKVSLAFFGVILAILFSLFYQETVIFLKKTKLERFSAMLPTLIVILLLVTTIYPAVQTALRQNTPTDEEITAFDWMEQHLPKNARVLALLEEGHLITYYAQRKNLMDDQFQRIQDVEGRLADLNTLFTTNFQTLAIDLLGRYDIEYIIFTPHAQQKYPQDNFLYLSIDCFERVYKGEVKIYQVKCRLNPLGESS